MKKPSVSVIIPAYNAQQTIASALESVLSQSFAPKEVILVDDGSTDETASIVKKLVRKEKRIKYIHQKNAGPSAARNAGLDAASGEYIAFCDADDRWKEGKLEAQVAFLEAHAQIDLAGTRSGNGSSQGGYRNITFRRLLFKNEFVTSTVLLRRSALGSLRFNPSQKFSEDYRFWLTAAFHHQAALLLGAYTVYGGGKPGFGHSGLSANLRAMEQGELSNFRWCVQQNYISVPLYLCACAWSLMKFSRRLALSSLRSKAKAVAAKRTILFVGNTSFSMYNFRLGVMRSLRDAGNTIVVAAPRDSFSGLFEKEGFTFEEIMMSRKGTNPLRELSTVKELYSLYRRVRPSLVFNYTIKPIIYGSVAAAFARVTSVAVTTGLGYAFVKENRFALSAIAARFLYRAALLFPRQVWFLNGEDREIFVSSRIVRKKKTRVIPGEGVDMKHFSPKKNASTKKPAFLLVARIVADKGVRDYAAAARILKKRKAACEIRLLGAFDDYPNAITPGEVASWEKEGLVRYLGVTTDVRATIAASDCIVLPSAYREGVPRSLMEGASMEKPLIATDIAGCRDIVRDGVTGFLCKPRDPESLALAMEKFIRLPAAKRELMGRNGRAMIRAEFDETIIAAIYRRAIDDICIG
jgi:glycosyltransferase involved in cell wall biosynthesis